MRPTRSARAGWRGFGNCCATEQAPSTGTAVATSRVAWAPYSQRSDRNRSPPPRSAADRLVRAVTPQGIQHFRRPGTGLGSQFPYDTGRTANPRTRGAAAAPEPREQTPISPVVNVDTQARYVRWRGPARTAYPNKLTTFVSDTAATGSGSGFSVPCSGM